MESLLKGTVSQIKELASKGLLTWQGKKVVLDPFLSLDVIIEIEAKENGLFAQAPKIVIGKQEEAIEELAFISSLGALQGSVFRFWKEIGLYQLIKQIKAEVSAKELEAFLQEDPPIRWKGEVPQLKPKPLPILKLTDRTGGFANLHLDYGEWGIAPFQSKPEEKYWENDLLETGFKKKLLGNSNYFCSLDQVGKSLSFLLDVGWKVIDFRGKQIVRQKGLECQTQEEHDAILLRGTVCFGEATKSIQDVVGAFERHERWIDLSPDTVGLIDLPPAWEAILEEKRSPQGIHVKKMHIGLLTGVVPLPPSYTQATWQEATPSSSFRGVLFPYQQKGVNWLVFLKQAGFSALLADEMGLGKTVQMLAFLSLQAGPTLIVMPVTLLALWKEQIHQFLPEVAVYMHQGIGRAQTVGELASYSLILTSYGTVRQDTHLFMQTSFETIILDEAQMIKNSATQIAQVIYRLKSNFRVALTGTPIENRPEEIISIFQFLMPTLDATAIKKIKPFLLRRTKQEVGVDLPEKMIQTVGIEPSEEEFSLYENLLCTKRTPLLEKIAEEGLSSHRMEVLELILRLRQHCSHPKLLDPSYSGACQKFERVLSDLEEIVASKQKVLLYSQFTSMLKLFENEVQARGWNYAYLDGSTRDREAPVSQFQTDPNTHIFLISLKAGGVGLNLQAADYVFLYDPWWNSAVEHQAIDRAHRIGRVGTVIARKYFTTHSIEAKILELQVKKEAIAQRLWDEEGVGGEGVTFKEIQELLGF